MRSSLESESVWVDCSLFFEIGNRTHGYGEGKEPQKRRLGKDIHCYRSLPRLRINTQVTATRHIVSSVFRRWTVKTITLDRPMVHRYHRCFGGLVALGAVFTTPKMLWFLDTNIYRSLCRHCQDQMACFCAKRLIPLLNPEAFWHRLKLLSRRSSEYT